MLFLSISEVKCGLSVFTEIASWDNSLRLGNWSFFFLTEIVLEIIPLSLGSLKSFFLWNSYCYRDNSLDPWAWGLISVFYSRCVNALQSYREGSPQSTAQGDWAAIDFPVCDNDSIVMFLSLQSIQIQIFQCPCKCLLQWVVSLMLIILHQLFTFYK